MQPPPARFPRQAQFIEPLGAVVLDAGRKEIAFPGDRRQVEPLQLRERLEDPRRPLAVRPPPQALVPGEKADKHLNRHRLDLPTQPLHRQPMDPREQSSVAPLDVGGGLHPRHGFMMPITTVIVATRPLTPLRVGTLGMGTSTPRGLGVPHLAVCRWRLFPGGGSRLSLG